MAHSNMDAVIGLAALTVVFGIAMFVLALIEYRERTPRRRKRSVYDVQRERAGYDAIAANEPPGERLRLR